jgi:hypothetical protein
VIPQHLSKKLRSKQRAKSKTPRQKQKKDKWSFGGSSIKHDNYDKFRPSTAGSFYPITSRQHSGFNNSPLITNKIKVKVNANFKSYDTIESYVVNEKQKSIDDPMRGDNVNKTKFKMNPSPYKRRERSIDELVHKLQSQIYELEQIEAHEIQKHMHGIKPKPKNRKKVKKTKARSHSPQETTFPIKKSIFSMPLFKNQISHYIVQNNAKLTKPKKQIQKGNVTSRNR